MALKKAQAADPAHSSCPYSPAEILADLRVAMLSRELDKVEKNWQKAGRAKFCILGAGQEIAQLAAARCLRPGDWLRSYYRGITESLVAQTVTPRQVLAQVLGDTEPGHDPSSGGRMMGRHFGSRVLNDDGELCELTAQINHASDISPTGSQMGPALGLALASKVFAATPAIEQRYPGLSKGGAEVAHVSIGDSSMAEGISLEMVNQAVVQRAPLVVSVYDNGFGISVPLDKQFTHASVSKALSGFGPQEVGGPGLRIIGPLEDWSYLALRQGYEEAFRWVRETGNPALVHVLVTQQEGHSSSGDHRRYKSAERLAWETKNDGIRNLKDFVLAEGIASAEELSAIEAEVRSEIRAEADAAWRQFYEPFAALAGRAHSIYMALSADPALAALLTASSPKSGASLAAAAAGLLTDADLGTRNYLTRGRILIFLRDLLAALRSRPGISAAAPLRELYGELKALAQARFSGQVYAAPEHSPLNAPRVAPRYAEQAPLDSGAHVIAAGFATLMSADPRIVAYGEDVGRLGGVTTCTLGLQSGEDQVEPAIWRKSPALQRYVPKTGFGTARVWDTAISEGTIVGAAAGMALRGLRPIAEIQYHDYVNYGAQQLEDEIACLRHRSNGGQEAPCIVRCHGHRLLGMWHAGSPMAMMLRMPGLRVATPRNAVQAVALYRAALAHGRDPVFSVEPLLDLYGRVPVPENLDEVCLPFGQSECLRPGNDISIVTYGHCCSLALAAADELAERWGIEAEVIDLQTLNPVDLNGLAAASIRKTGKLLLVDEDYANGAAAMLAKTLLFDRRDEAGRPMTWYLDGLRIHTAPEHKPAYGADGGFFSKPQAHSIVDEALGLLDELDGAERSLA